MGYGKVKCKILNIRGVNEVNIELLSDNINDYNYIYLTPDYWIVNRNSAFLILGTLFGFIFSTLVMADLKGHFSSKLFFDPREE
jgi:hypothetical protein